MQKSQSLQNQKIHDFAQILLMTFLKLCSKAIFNFKARKLVRLKLEEQKNCFFFEKKNELRRQNEC